MQSIYTNLGEFLDKFPEEEQEETEVTKKEIEDTVAAAVAKALETQQKPAADPVQKAAEPAAEPAGLTVEEAKIPEAMARATSSISLVMCGIIKVSERSSPRRLFGFC